MSISPDSLLSLEAYQDYRQAHHEDILQHRQCRSVFLGEHMCLQFESEQTLRYQLQEVLLAERLVEAEDVERERARYAALLPSGHEWRATLLIEFTDARQRELELPQLLGVEQRFFVEVQGMGRVYAQANEDMPAEPDAEPAAQTVVAAKAAAPTAPAATAPRMSAVHFLRFSFTPEQCQALLTGTPATVGCEHPAYPVDMEIPPATLGSLLGDFSG